MEKGKLVYVRGNVLQPQRLKKDEIVIIPHCCNDIGVMGAGVALTLKTIWPKVAESYSQAPLILGNIFWEQVEEDIVVVNMIGQKGVRSTDNPKPVKYWALAKAMQKTCEAMQNIIWWGKKSKKAVVHCPKFGSDLAGGKWEFIEELIQEIWCERGFDVVVYEFEPDEENWGPIGDYSIDVYNGEIE